MKKFLLVFIMIFSIFIITGCEKKLDDAKKFKEEYESLNGIVNDNGKSIRTINIDLNNPFVYKTEDDIVSMIINKETFLVYFGFPKCPWCRSMLESLIEVAKEYDLETIYYVNVLDIRDTIDKTGNRTKEGTEGYYKLLGLMNDVLSDYDIKDDNGKKVNVNEKRIYAPNVVAVIDGHANKLTTGLSDKQNDAYMELTDDIKNDMKSSLTDVVSIVQEKLTTCDKGC